MKGLWPFVCFEEEMHHGEEQEAWEQVERALHTAAEARDAHQSVVVYVETCHLVRAHQSLDMRVYRSIGQRRTAVRGGGRSRCLEETLWVCVCVCAPGRSRAVCEIERVATMLPTYLQSSSFFVTNFEFFSHNCTCITTSYSKLLTHARRASLEARLPQRRLACVLKGKGGMLLESLCAWPS